MNISPSFLYILLSSILITPSYANINDFENIDDANDTNPAIKLSSLQNLSSLKNIGKQTIYQAPFVQEVPNSKNVRTLFVASQDLPIVDIQLTFNAGSAQDEKMGSGLYGVSNMAARLISEGTDQYNAKQLTSAFDALGAKFSVHAYRDMFTIRLRVMSDPQKLEGALNLLLHLINHANFNQSGLNLVLNNTQVGQKQIQENPSRLMSIRFYRSVYGSHPYAQPIAGTQGSLKKINPDILKKFRDQFLVAQNSNIAITGQLSLAQATKISETISSNLPQGEKAEQIQDPEPSKKVDVQIIPFSSSQAYVTMGHLGINRSNPDRIALEVANHIFGGNSFNSVLSKELRIKRGYTYSASSSLSSTQSNGLFSFTYSTQQKQLLDSIQVAHQTYKSFIEQPITALQLRETKEGLLRAFPMSLSSNANINAQIASIGFYGLDANYLDQYQKKLNALKPSDITQVIKKYFHADNMTTVVVSNNVDKTQLLNILEGDDKSQKVDKN